MMKIIKLIILLSINLIWTGCTEGTLRGCTNCNAVNFNYDANEDDASCILINTNRLGEYAVVDSTMDWVFTWWDDEYNISIVREPCNSIGIEINNYANLSSSDKSFNVRADITGDSILIPYQIVLGYEIIETNGYFKEDSIFFQIYYLTPTFSDPYIGFVQGIKIN